MRPDVAVHVRSEERPLFSRLRELAARAEESAQPALTHFLTPREARIARMAAGVEGAVCKCFGGYDGAERVRASFGTDRFPRLDQEWGIVCLCAQVGRGEPAPAHGDVLGSLMNLGYQRERMGDVLVSAGEIYVFLEEPAAKTVLRDWSRAGKASLRTARCAVPPLDQLPRPRTVERVVTVRSLRLDAFVGHAFGMSRTKALDPIRAGRVSLNFAVCEDPAEEVEPGDVVSVRGFGRAMVVATEGESRSGRIFVRIARFL